MGFIDWEESEPALFEMQVRESIRQGESVWFRAQTALAPQFVLIQKGPIAGTVTVDIPRTLAARDVRRLITCLTVYSESMNDAP